MDLHLFLSTFALIFFAELPDKTAFATVILAARDRAAAVFTGVALAFLVQTLVALAFGSVFAMLPPPVVHGVAGAIFLFFAIHLWLTRKADQEEEDGEEIKVAPSFFQSAWRSFLVIFIAEWGDLTQIATASLVAKFPENRFTIFSASVLALWSVTAVAVLLGQKLKTALNPKWLKVGCAVVCLLMAGYFGYEVLQETLLKS